MQSVKGRRIHSQAEQARERGEFLEALKFTDEAMIVYQADGDILGLAEIQASRFLTFRHLFEKTNDRNFLVLAKYAAMSAVEIAEGLGDKTALAIPLFNLAKSQETLGQLAEAVATYQKAVSAIESYAPAFHNRPAVKADFRIHLTTCEYMAGDKTALDRAEAAISDLAVAEELKYNKDVWLSGGYMRLATALRSDDPVKAKTYLGKAKEVIDSNPELTLRKGQWEKLSVDLSL